MSNGRSKVQEDGLSEAILQNKEEFIEQVNEPLEISAGLQHAQNGYSMHSSSG